MRRAKPYIALDRRVIRSGLFRAGSRVVVACSGGPDSVALAVLLDRLAPVLEIEPIVAHVNHGVRPSAWQDECVVLSLAARLGRSLRVTALDGVRRDEASLRAARYAALATIAASEGASAVATAHTAEDQTETVLLALFRGTGPDGIAGIAERRPLASGVDLVRPLLGATHADLAGELYRSGLPYARDPTNRDRGRARNAVRAALGDLREVFPALDRAVSRYGEIVRAEVNGTPIAERRRIVRRLLAAAGVQRDIPFERIAAAAGARAGPPRTIDLKRTAQLAIGENLGTARILRRHD